MKLTEQNLKECINLVQVVIHLLPDNPKEWESEDSFMNTRMKLLNELLKAIHKLDEFIEFVFSEDYEGFKEDFENFKEGKLSKKEFIRNVKRYNVITMKKSGNFLKTNK